MPTVDLNVDFILGSGSPRRRRLLERHGFEFRVVVSGADETIPESAPPVEIVERLARRKAHAVAESEQDALILAADTIVVLDREVLEKPDHNDEASEMLRRLSGRTHTVYTGIALLHPPSDRSVTAHELTHVTFGRLSDDEIAAYVATGSPLDKAGAYGIQDDLGALFISRIDGDYYNVVGLPLHRLYRVLRQQFDDLFSLSNAGDQPS